MTTSPVQTFRKDPSDVKDYGFNFDPTTDPFLESGETIDDVDFTVPTGITKDLESVSDTTAIIWLSGGTAGESYIIACKITTTDGRIHERSIEIIVENR